MSFPSPANESGPWGARHPVTRRDLMQSALVAMGAAGLVAGDERSTVGLDRFSKRFFDKSRVVRSESILSAWRRA